MKRCLNKSASVSRAAAVSSCAHFNAVRFTFAQLFFGFFGFLLESAPI